MRLRLGFWPVGERQPRVIKTVVGVPPGKCACSKHAWNPECPVHPPQVRR